MLQALQGSVAREKVAETDQVYNGKGVFFQPYYPRIILRGGTEQQQKRPQPPSVA
jgi:hypothetical protein